MKSELFFAVALLGAGLLLLPLSVFTVGQIVFGTYEGDGAAGLLGDIWTALGQGSPTAWLLVLSPYVVFQLLRAALGLLRRRRVTPANKTSQSPAA